MLFVAWNVNTRKGSGFSWILSICKIFILSLEYLFLRNVFKMENISKQLCHVIRLKMHHSGLNPRGPSPVTLTTRDKCPQFAAVNSFVREAGACLNGSHSLLLKDVWLCQ